MAKPKDKQPWFKFYPQDWRGDAKLRMCSIGARGLWAEMLCVMHEAEPYGYLLSNGKNVTSRQMASLAGISQPECMKYMLELAGAGVYSLDENSAVFSRRMVRDREKAEKAKNDGLVGGNPEIRRGTVPKDQRLRPFKRSDAPQKTQRIFQRSGGKCHWCSTDLVFQPDGLANNNFHVDHVIAICDGGTNDEANLVAACADCNHKRARVVTVGFNSDHKPQIPEARLDDGTKTRASLISAEAFEVTGALERACGFALPEEIPPGWYGCAMWVQKCLSEGWNPAVMIDAARAVAMRKKGGFIESFKYLEKPLAQAMAEHAAPLPQVEIRQPEKLTVVANGTTGNVIAASDKLQSIIDSFGGRAREADDLRSAESPPHVRLLSQG